MVQPRQHGSIAYIDASSSRLRMGLGMGLLGCALVLGSTDAQAASNTGPTRLKRILHIFGRPTSNQSKVSIGCGLCL